MPFNPKNIALEPTRAINRPITKPVDEWGFGEGGGAGSDVSNLLLETGDNLLLESGSSDVLILE